MKRGVWLLIVGVAFVLFGYFIMEKQWEISGWKVKYGWAMIIGTVLFGAGFLNVLYSLIRKVERHAILEERAEEQAHAEADRNSS